MGTATPISVEEYLSTTYRPDCDYVDGQVVERTFGEYDHADLQGTVYAWFRKRRNEWNIRVAVELRVQVSATRFRIPDICVTTRERREQVITHSPLICIEILSKDDTLRRLQQRVTDYFNFGVPNVWIIDPETQRAYVCSTYGFIEPENGVLEVAGTNIRLPLAEPFADLD